MMVPCNSSTRMSMTSSMILVICISTLIQRGALAFVSQPRHFGIIQSAPVQALHQLKMTVSNSTVATTEGGNKDGIQLRASPIKKKMPSHDVGGPVEPISSIDSFLQTIEGAPKDGLVVVL